MASAPGVEELVQFRLNVVWPCRFVLLVAKMASSSSAVVIDATLYDGGKVLKLRFAVCRVPVLLVAVARDPSHPIVSF